MTTHRYLTREEKGRELAAWRELREKGAPAGNQAGRGYPDPDILPWCPLAGEKRLAGRIRKCCG